MCEVLWHWSFVFISTMFNIRLRLRSAMCASAATPVAYFDLPGISVVA